MLWVVVSSEWSHASWCCRLWCAFCIGWHQKLAFHGVRSGMFHSTTRNLLLNPSTRRRRSVASSYACNIYHHHHHHHPHPHPVHCRHDDMIEHAGPLSSCWVSSVEWTARCHAVTYWVAAFQSRHWSHSTGCSKTNGATLYFSEYLQNHWR